MAMSIGEYFAHVGGNRACTKVRYICRRCSNPYEKRHATRCHITKCSGHIEPLAVVCSECEARFATRRELSTHQCNSHPTTRDLATCPDKINNPPRWLTEWSRMFTTQQLSAMYSMERDHRGHPRIAMKMADNLGLGDTLGNSQEFA